MIDAQKVWLPQILHYATLISEEETLRKAWRDGDASKTSVISYDELIEQMFDDLASNEIILVEKEALSEDNELYILLSSFISEIKKFDSDQSDRQASGAPEQILSSIEWRAVREAASRLVKYAAAQGLTGNEQCAFPSITPPPRK